MNELVKHIGLEYHVKMYINRSDLYMDTVADIHWGVTNVIYHYRYDQGMVVIYLGSERHRLTGF